jgi:pentose-5-phosphate-3-epimerase
MRGGLQRLNSMLITPAILAKNEEEFRNRMVFVHQLPEGRWHVDVLDGSRHEATCWHDANVVGDLPDLPEIEIHLMVQDPFTEILAWHRAVPTLRRALIEADTYRLQNVLRQVQALKLDVSLVLNPDVAPDICASFQNDIDEIMIMGVRPGASAQKFLGEEIFAKIARTRALFPSLALAVDGGVRQEIISLLAKAGIMRVVASSALWESPSPSDAHLALQEAAKIVL